MSWLKITTKHKLRRFRHCERSEAISMKNKEYNVLPYGNGIASLHYVTLAMTEGNDCYTRNDRVRRTARSFIIQNNSNSLNININ